MALEARKPAHEDKGARAVLPLRPAPKPPEPALEPDLPLAGAAGPPGEEQAAPARRRRLVSPLIRPILAINLVALAILGGGLLYLDDYRKGLIAQEQESLRAQGVIVAAALGESGVGGSAIDPPELQPEAARALLRRVVTTMNIRTRLFGADGELIADSRILLGPGGAVQIRELPVPAKGNAATRFLIGLYDTIVGILPAGRSMPYYDEQPVQRAADYDEARRALRGEVGAMVRATDEGGLIVSVGVPVQRYKQVLGALMLSRGGADIEAAVRTVRFDIIRLFLVSLTITVLLSLYLAAAIARPVRRLAAAADRVRRAHGQGQRRQTIPDFTRRGDEIGDLSAALREMTEALWRRIDAIESFAADVAHEIKNPLTSLRSAVETVARVTDPEQQRRLLQIIQDDVQRLDRLISDISDASRIDAELARAEVEPVDIAGVLTTLADTHDAVTDGEAPRLRVEVGRGRHLAVMGIEGRLVQVFRNLLSNAISFSPPRGSIVLRARRDGRFVTVTVEDEGPGIPAGRERAIFKRFYTERPTGEKFGTHSGLGLSISRQIVEAHRGTIRAENRVDADGRVLGARFTVRLPVD